VRVLRDTRWMLFVDGENFTKAGQRMLTGAGLRLMKGRYWLPDVFLWTPNGTGPHWYAIEPKRSGTGAASFFMPSPDAHLVRAYYYTSTVSNEPEWTKTRIAIRQLGFEPRLFQRRKGRTKAVDIALATDVLALGAARQYDAAVIVSGDGDYVPLLEAVKRMGLHAAAAFVSNDLSPEIPITADEFASLSLPLLSDWSSYIQHELKLPPPNIANALKRLEAEEVGEMDQPPVADEPAE
jgi:hypothetical protein